jgi:23S rRNA-/tRNA-specific pseudouridylate synthase
MRTYCIEFQTGKKTALLEARPFTGRTHQIRVHLATGGHPIVGDELYGPPGGKQKALGLRAIGWTYTDPFTRRVVHVRASVEAFVREYGFDNP